jgi:hypothetical protein
VLMAVRSYPSGAAGERQPLAARPAFWYPNMFRTAVETA